MPLELVIGSVAGSAILTTALVGCVDGQGGFEAGFNSQGGAGFGLHHQRPSQITNNGFGGFPPKQNIRPRSPFGGMFPYGSQPALAYFPDGALSPNSFFQNIPSYGIQYPNQPGMPMVNGGLNVGFGTDCCGFFNFGPDWTAPNNTGGLRMGDN